MRVSQAPPPDLSTMPTSGAEPMGGAMPGEPGAEAPPTPTFKVIYSPLDSLGKILADLDFKTYLQNNFGTDPDESAHKVWVMYGGSENELSPGKKGRRSDKPPSADPVELEQLQTTEYNNTRDKRWERLPLGVSIEQITTPQALSQSIEGGYDALIKQYAKPATSSVLKWIKAAEKADDLKSFYMSDQIIKLIYNVYSS